LVRQRTLARLAELLAHQRGSVSNEAQNTVLKLDVEIERPEGSFESTGIVLFDCCGRGRAILQPANPVAQPISFAVFLWEKLVSTSCSLRLVQFEAMEPKKSAKSDGSGVIRLGQLGR
jgi:hypothetical protein